MKRIVIRDVRSGKLFSVKAESETLIPGFEPGDAILEVIPVTLIEGRELTPEECKELIPTPGFRTVGAYELPRYVDAAPAKYLLADAPWAN